MPRILDLRRGEATRVVWVAAIGLVCAAATSMGDDVAQSIFVARVGADGLPRMYLLKGLLDVVAAMIYLPLARGRPPGRVLTSALALYALTVTGGRLLVTDGSTATAYALYVGHEAAWTVITIHWGVFVLDAFDASQARRLFPLLFAVATVGRIAAGSLLTVAVEAVGAADLLWVTVGLAGLGMALSLGRRGVAAARAALLPEDHEAAPRPDDDRADASSSTSSLAAASRDAMRSKLVRAIAASTALMVLVRYGLHMASLDRISAHFAGGEAEIAAFLGTFTAAANGVSVVLALFAVPRLLHALGPRFANMVYAFATVAAYGALIAMPSLLTAAGARFTQQQLKDSLKTPLSTLFYGAEPPPARAPARAFVFGAVIPAATVATSVIFELLTGWRIIALVGLGASGAFALACAVQNRQWRDQLVDLLRWKLAAAPAADRDRVAALADQIGPGAGELAEPLAQGLASPEPRVRAVAAELLAETIPRRAAHRLAASEPAAACPD